MFNLGVSRPDRDLPDRPTHSISTWFQLEPMLPSVSFGFPCPRPNASGSSGRFSSPKPEPPDLKEVIYKSGEIKLKSEEIQQVLNHIWWDLARSSHSQQILAILVQILANLMQIWWVFTFFGDDLVDSDAFFFFFFYKCRWLLQLQQRTKTDQTNPISNRTQNQLDQLTPTIGFRSLFFPPDADMSGLSWVENRPNLTHG